MRLATFNVENLFDRPKAMNLDSWAEGKPVLDRFARLSALLGEINYTAARKARMVELLTSLGLAKSDEGPFVMLRQNKGDLLKRPKAGPPEIVANGRADWSGSLELIEKPVDDEAMRNTARVMKDIEADVLAVVEAESRPALAAFNDEIIRALGGVPYAGVMLIDGNDSRGIDVGLLTRPPFQIGAMRSHVDDRDAKGDRIFSRDCPEYGIGLGDGRVLWVLPNHLKSKGFGSPKESTARRLAQAQRIRAIYQAKRAAGEDLVAVVGDFNDTPDSDALSPLLHDTDLRDVYTHAAFDDGGHPGTFGPCTASNKIDYILLSPAAWARVTGGGVWRKGMWPGVKPVKWDVYPELTRPAQAASDHAAVWVDLDL